MLKHTSINLDLIGITTSLVCAIHCAFVPLLLSFSSLSSIQFLENVWLETSIVLLSFIIASFALLRGYLNHHHNFWPIIIVTLGFMLIGTGHIVKSDLSESVLMTLGAINVTIAHIVNWKQIRKSHRT